MVVHADAAPRFEADALLDAGRELAQHDDVEEVAALATVLGAAGLLAVEAPHLGQQRPRQLVVVVQHPVQVRDQVPHRHRAPGDALHHERTQAEAAGVVAHPAGLERRVLAVVGEHQEPPALGAVDHVLGQHVHVGDGHRAHRPRRLAPQARPLPARSPAREARGEPAGPLLVVHGVERHEPPLAAAAVAAFEGLGMERAAERAQVNRHRAAGLLGILLVLLGGDEAIQQHHARAAARAVERSPDAAGPHGLAAFSRPGVELEIGHEVLEVVLPAGIAGHHRKAVAVGGRP